MVHSEAEGRTVGALLEAFAARCKQTGDPLLAAQDLVEAMASEREGERLRSMRRWRARGEPTPEFVGPPAPGRQLLRSPFWRTHRLDPNPDGYFRTSDLETWVVCEVSTDAELRDFVFYVWEPDLKQIWPELGLVGNSWETKNNLPTNRTATATSAQVWEAPKKRGQRRIYPWDKIRLETVRRIFNNGRPEWPKSDSQLAGDIEQWCLEQFKKAPTNSELRKMVADVVQRLRALLS
jgi:hypothetical protein